MKSIEKMVKKYFENLDSKGKQEASGTNSGLNQGGTGELDDEDYLSCYSHF
jgi:hypothetical protein